MYAVNHDATGDDGDDDGSMHVNELGEDSQRRYLGESPRDNSLDRAHPARLVAMLSPSSPSTRSPTASPSAPANSTFRYTSYISHAVVLRNARVSVQTFYSSFSAPLGSRP